ncbi:MAG: hypothetical protein GY847_41465 [Proteobacteria bacterium]|nr:hypothetical protein [Pseudomonadota bacterium]
MTVRLRFVLFFLAGVAVAIIPMTIFLIIGVLDIQKGFVLNDLVLGLGSSIVSLVAAAVALIVVLKRFDHPVAALIEGVEQISKGNLSPDLPDDAPAEFGHIKNALDTMCGHMRMVLSQLNTLSEHVVESTTGAGDSFTEVRKGADVQSETAMRTFDAIGNLREGLLEASRGVESLARRIDTSALQVSEMDVAIKQVNEMIGGLNDSIVQASETTRQGDENTRVLAKDVTGLSSSVSTAQNALGEMMNVAEQARSDAGYSAIIIGNLESDTGRISAAIEDVIKGSDAAHASNERILEVTTNLQSRVDKVDDVIELIGSLAERTKLLSINASIIASEAGEHGRAFAVVASEVKDLAQSTAGAISEISKVIVGLKEGFTQAVETIQCGQEDVEKGVRLARNAVALLGSIPDEVHKAAACNAEIVGRTERQVEKGAQVEKIIGKVGTTLEQVTQLLTEQVTRNNRTLALFQNINLTADQAQKTTQAHAKASGDVTRNVETISKDFRALAEQVREHVSNLSNVVKLSEDVLSITSSNRRRAAELSTLIDDLNRYALYLGDDFRKLGDNEDHRSPPS